MAQFSPAPLCSDWPSLEKIRLPEHRDVVRSVVLEPGLSSSSPGRGQISRHYVPERLALTVYFVCFFQIRFLWTALGDEHLGQRQEKQQ